MAYAFRIQYPGACYHAACHENEQRDMYQVIEDKRIFKSKLKVSQEIYSVVSIPIGYHPVAWECS
jgi:hypothetical protein